MDSFLSSLSQLVEEVEEEEKAEDGETFIHLHAEKDAVKDSMSKDGSNKNHRLCFQSSINTPIIEAIVIAHQNGKEEMSWD